MWALAIDHKNGGHDGKRWFIGINSFLAGPVIISNKNWNIPIKWKVVITFWNSAYYMLERDSFLSSFPLCSRELCLKKLVFDQFQVKYWTNQVQINAEGVWCMKEWLKQGLSKYYWRVFMKIKVTCLKNNTVELTKNSYLAKFSYFCFGYMFQGHIKPIPVSNASINHTKSSLSKDWSNLVSLVKRFEALLLL